jgi:phosphate transport system substrate-binding protein
MAGFWAVCAVSFAAGGCGGDNDADVAGPGGLSALSGKIEIDGSSTVYPITEAAATSFREFFPEVKVTVAISGTGGGFKRFTQGETDISDASRPIKPAEFEQCKKNSVPFVELPVAYDGLTIVVHPDNKWAEQLTVEQLQKIFREDQAAARWSDVDASWPNEPIKIYAPGTDSGTFDYFREVVAKDSAVRSDMSTSEDDNVLVTGVAGELHAIGFFGAAYYFENQDKLKAVKIVNPDSGQAVAPSTETIVNGDYAPFSRPLFIYVKEASLTRPEMKKFVEFYLDNAAEMAKQVDYAPLPDDVCKTAREHYEKRLVGTHFLDADGQKRSGPLPVVYTPENVVGFE